MYLDRRGFLRFGLGAVTMALSAAPLFPTDAYAIAGVDDAVVGGVVLALLTLAGYAVSAEVSQASLSAMGYSFIGFASDASNRGAAVSRAIADANNLGIEVNRAQAESAAQAIAAGTGAVGEWLADIADSGRIALDGIVNGVGAIPAALWGLIAQYQETMLDVYDTATADTAFAADQNRTVGNLVTGTTVRVVPLQTLLASTGIPSFVIQPTWCVVVKREGLRPQVYLGNEETPYLTGVGTLNVLAYAVNTSATCYEYYYSSNQWKNVQRSGAQGLSEKSLIVSADMVIGPTLPGVDRASDAPETYGAGYDKTILGNDLVINPSGEVVSAGTIALPVEYPYVQLPYVEGLYRQGAGVVTGLQDLPISGQTSVVVGTEEGVVSMPISQAISTSTSLAEVVTPAEPVVPPGTPDVGPWQPAYSMPFYEVWPFNIVYTFVEQISALGGS